jgi:predicted transcriptional regulator
MSKSARPPAGSGPPRQSRPGVEEAPSDYVDKAEAYRRYIQEGLDDIAAGRTHPWSEVRAELRAKYGDPDA